MRRERYFPVFLDLAGVRCLVVGGGAVARRKIDGLLEAGAEVTVVSPEADAAVQAHARAGRLRWVRTRYAPRHLAATRIVVAATSDREVNHGVSRDAGQRGILVNVVDDPEHCRFIVPAVARQGDIVAAVVSGGGAPGVSSRIRDEIARNILPRYERLVVALKARRERVKRLPLELRRAFWKDVAAIDRRDLLSTGLERRIEALLARREASHDK